MPRETISSQLDFPVEVSWGREHAYVQIGAIMKEPQNDLEPQNLQELLESWGPSASTARGLFAQLDREALNKLIRVLRRARDQAYGKDE